MQQVCVFLKDSNDNDESFLSVVNLGKQSIFSSLKSLVTQSICVNCFMFDSVQGVNAVTENYYALSENILTSSEVSGRTLYD